MKRFYTKILSIVIAADLSAAEKVSVLLPSAVKVSLCSVALAVRLIAGTSDSSMTNTNNSAVSLLVVFVF